MGSAPWEQDDYGQCSRSTDTRCAEIFVVAMHSGAYNPNNRELAGYCVDRHHSRIPCGGLERSTPPRCGRVGPAGGRNRKSMQN